MRVVDADAGQRYARHVNPLIVEFHPQRWSCTACKLPDLLRLYLLGRIIGVVADPSMRGELYEEINIIEPQLTHERQTLRDISIAISFILVTSIS